MKYIPLLLLLGAIAFSSGCKPAKKPNPSMAIKADSLKKALAAKDDIKSITEVTKKCKLYKGLFSVYQDTTNGGLFMLVKKDQIGKDFIYWSYAIDGTVATGNYRGAFRDNKTFKVTRYFNRIEFEEVNQNYYLEPGSAISKVRANWMNSVLLSQPIVGQSADKTEVLIKADELFLSEAIQAIKPRTLSPLASLGSISKDKSKVLSIKAYPANTDVSVEYVFEGAGLAGGADVADSRYNSLKVQHTILEVPQNNYKPRFEDYRIGYFETSQDVLTNSSATPYRDMIHRWHIEKKDPTAALSEAKEPVVYWIENTTPLEFRPIIKAAGERWNRAFEKAGISNAIVIKEQSDTATWDAGDIRYNVLRWSTSPFPPFGGYGPSFVNPATGQILGADIIFDFAFVSNRIKQSRLLTGGYNEYEGQLPESNNTSHSCAIGAQMQHQFQTGATLLKYLGVGTEEQDRYLTESLHYLILHEMGHTLGLMHNMKSSQFLSPAQLKDFSKTKDGAITGSVMDYPCVNLHPDGKTKVSFFTMTPGPYDDWAIEFGYSAALADSTAEVARLATIASRSTEAKLAFGNDADDMRGNASGIDPRVMIDDLSSDGIAYAKDRLKLMKQLSGQLEAKLKLVGKPNGLQDKSYQELVTQYNIVSREQLNCARVLTRYIGGVYVERATPGTSNVKPLTPVPATDQQRAMAILVESIIAPDALASSPEFIAYLQQQRRGFKFFGAGEDPKVLSRHKAVYSEVLNHLLSSSTLQRIVNSELYGNDYKLNQMMAQLTDAIFPAKPQAKNAGYLQLLQGMYVQELVELLNKSNNTQQGSPLPANVNQVVYENIMRIRTRLFAYRNVSGFEAQGRYLLWQTEKGIATK